MRSPTAGDLHPPAAAVVAVVGAALAEDLLPLGDLTASLVPPGATARARLVARAAGVLAGVAGAEETFRQVGGGVSVAWHLDDGDRLEAGSVIADVWGPLRPILTAERTALNLLGHLSGVASLTRRYVDAAAAANPRCRVRDTRKTTPGLRALEKAAVRAGGGFNHRANLADAILVKDNHLGGLSITEAVRAARHAWPGRHVEVECDGWEQVQEALAVGADMIMLDNMDPEATARAVRAVREVSDVPLEVSGGLNLDTVAAYAAAGVDFLSVGALTHSAPVLDIGLDLATDTAGA